MNFATAPLGRLRTRFVGGTRRFRFGVTALDQMALSAFAFALNLSLIRALTATEFGVVSLWLAMGMLALSVQNALVGSPLNVHLPAAPDPARARRLEDAVGVVNLFAIALATATAMLASMLADAAWAPQDTVTALAIPLFIAAGMYREYSRFLAFSRGDMAMLLWIDAPYLAVTTLCLAAILVWPAWFANLAAVFFAMSAGCIVSQLLLRGRFAFPALQPFERGWLREYRQIAGDVTWSLSGVFASHLQERAYIYITVNLVSLAGLAAIAVIGILFRPLGILTAAWGRGALPNMAAELAAGRVEAFDRTMLRALVVATIGGAAWFLVLWLAWPPIERHFLGAKYQNAWSLMLPWAIAATLGAIEYMIGIALQAAREFKFLAHATLLSAPVMVAGTAGAILVHDYTWTMYGVASGTLVALIIKAGRLHSMRRELLAGSAAGQQNSSLMAERRGAASGS